MAVPLTASYWLRRDSVDVIVCAWTRLPIWPTDRRRRRHLGRGWKGGIGQPWRGNKHTLVELRLGPYQSRNQDRGKGGQVLRLLASYPGLVSPRDPGRRYKALRPRRHLNPSLQPHHRHHHHISCFTTTRTSITNHTPHHNHHHHTHQPPKPPKWPPSPTKPSSSNPSPPPPPSRACTSPSSPAPSTPLPPPPPAA